MIDLGFRKDANSFALLFVPRQTPTKATDLATAIETESGKNGLRLNGKSTHISNTSLAVRKVGVGHLLPDRELGSDVLTALTARKMPMITDTIGKLLLQLSGNF